METKDMKSVVRERAIHNYIRGLDEGDSAAVEQVLELAQIDTTLADMLTQIDGAYAEEVGISIELDAEKVVSLLHKHFPDNVQSISSSKPLTVGEVVAHLKAKRLILNIDQTVAERLVKNTSQLPQNLSLAEVKKLSLELEIHASDSFWRDFRKTAITLSIGQDSESQKILAAARERKLHKGKRETKDE